MPDVVTCCQEQLVKDSGCCLDSSKPASVRQQRLTRPGTSWTCDAPRCSDADSLAGGRGDDLVSAPSEASCASPRILWIHGGSWMYGSPFSLGYDALASKLAMLTGAVVMVPDYPLLPIGNYSTILDAAIHALQWLATLASVNGLSCGLSEASPPMFLAGDSSGGGSALSLLLHLMKDPELLPIATRVSGGIFWSPWTNLMCNTPDYFANVYSKSVAQLGGKRVQVRSGDIIFTGSADDNSADFRENALEYLGQAHQMLTDPVASPYFAGDEELAAMLPPLYFAVGAEESILGDSVIFAQKAAVHGTAVRVDVFHGMWHVFPMYSEGCGCGHELWQGARAWNLTANFVRSVEGGGVFGAGVTTALREPLTRIIYDESTLYGQGQGLPESGLLLPLSDRPIGVMGDAFALGPAAMTYTATGLAGLLLGLLLARPCFWPGLRLRRCLGRCYLRRKAIDSDSDI
ncbi:unnamed protein product [Polarella glacialis]|uniref:Alpha/beta hydrolase fold-3 domain-containing protein n=1 Tax=Polarella glacialis TaxID=89957 RepID=A0A813DT69_POLGL|nr:unnamed protein product [Polarella glacialis]CAE8656266.1 unnamed protein product [Polarella glacialis]